MKKKKKKYFTELAAKYKSDSANPQCSHFGKCGGCMFQDIAYENQLLLKKEYLNELMEGVAHIDAVYPSRPFKYRNRMDMVTAFGKTGLREAGTYKYVVDVESCLIMQEKSNRLYQLLRRLLKDIEQYNYLSHRGYHRYIVLREAMFTGQLMANFVVAKEENRLKHVIDEIMDMVDSVSIILSDSPADVSFGRALYDIKTGYIEESFDNIRYRITPNSFFQSNSEIALRIYREIRKETEGRTLDLYSGVGSISLFVSEKAEHITGVEAVPEAVETACINRQINNIDNADFICEDAKDFMKKNSRPFDTLILDPPRSGINPKIIKHIEKMKPKKIIYMSCNPAMFKNDFLSMTDYSLEKFSAYDMFPQTPHVETLAVLKRK